jgi:hypothetical protein
MYRYDIYIGSNNKTRRIEEDYKQKIVDWARSAFPDGYTITRCEGYYSGLAEDSIVLTILSDGNFDLNSVAKLKKALEQDAILIAKYKIEMEVV